MKRTCVTDRFWPGADPDLRCTTDRSRCTAAIRRDELDNSSQSVFPTIRQAGNAFWLSAEIGWSKAEGIEGGDETVALHEIPA